MEHASPPEPRRLAPLAAPVPTPELRAEVQRLSAGAVLVESGPWQVLSVRAWQAPRLMHELGRLREESFRAVGEGTGRALDLDAFDRSYRHLVLWHRGEGKVAGAYRLGATDELLASQGCRALYTHSLFQIDPRLFAATGPALELGRSFVRREHQRSFSVLLLLWRGIGAVLAQEPHYRYLFGALTISAEFRELTRDLMLAYLERRRAGGPWDGLVRARRPLPPGALGRTAVALAVPEAIEALSAAVEELEEGRLRLPVLLRQYLRLGARVLDFSVDPDFGNAVDAFVLLDLCQTPPEQLVRYLGAEGLERFLAQHAATERAQPASA